jgi:hypothetical protein
MKYQNPAKESTPTEDSVKATPPNTPANCAYYQGQLYSVGAFITIPSSKQLMKVTADGTWQVVSPPTLK